MALITCPECGREISERAETCPHCGFPIHESNNITAEMTQAKENGQSAFSQKRGSFETAVKKKHGTLIAIIAVAVLAIAGVLVGGAVHEAREKRAEAAAAAEAREKYIINLHNAQISMLMTGYEAEQAATLIHDVWYNTIFKKGSTTTDRYTREPYTKKEVQFIDGDWQVVETQQYTSFYDDFNTSINNLFADEDFQSKIDSIEEGCNEAAKLYAELQNPPQDLSAASAALNEMYDAFQALSTCATNPTGSLQSYTAAFNEADSAFLKAYDKLSALMPDLPEIDKTSTD